MLRLLIRCETTSQHHPHDQLTVVGIHVCVDLTIVVIAESGVRSGCCIFCYCFVSSSNEVEL